MPATLAFDKPTYSPGDTITLTVTDPTLVEVTPPEVETTTYTENDGDVVTQTTSIQHPPIQDQPTVPTSSAGRVYALKSLSGTVAVFTTKA